MLAMCSYRSRASLEARFGRERAGDGRYAVESWLQHHGQALVDRFDASSYVTLTRAMDSHDVGRGRGGWREALATVAAPALVVSIDSDVLYPPLEQAELAAALPSAELHTLSSPHGHDAFLIEGEAVGRLVADFSASIDARAPGGGRAQGTRDPAATARRRRAAVAGLKRRVLKFGGTSVGAPGPLRAAVGIVERSVRETPVVVVVSALSGSLTGSRRRSPAPRPAASTRGHFTRGCATGTWRCSAPLPRDGPRRVPRPRSSKRCRRSIACWRRRRRRSLVAGRARLGAGGGREASAPLFAAALLSLPNAEARAIDAAPLVRTDASWAEAAVDFPATRRLVDDGARRAIARVRARGHRLHRRHRAWERPRCSAGAAPTTRPRSSAGRSRPSASRSGPTCRA